MNIKRSSLPTLEAGPFVAWCKESLGMEIDFVGPSVYDLHRSMIAFPSDLEADVWAAYPLWKESVAA